LSAAFSSFNAQQAFLLCTYFVLASCAAAAARLVLLPSARDYQPFLGLLATWAVFCVLTVAVPVTSKLYFRIYEVAAPVSWVLYLFVARNLYQKIFKYYRGIAAVGRWSLYAGLFCVCAAAIGSVVFSQGRFSSSRTFTMITMIDRCLLFGLSLFLLILVSVMSRYPISIQRNIGIHSLLFSLILFSQSISLIGDQWTSFHHTLTWNAITAGFDAICLSAWALLLTREGDTAIVRVRQHLDPALETRLLGELDALNGILLRAVRK
jgi:hypothetical protein